MQPLRLGGRRLDSFDSPNIYVEAFAMVDARLKKISSLQDIIVGVYEEGPSSDIRKKMKEPWMDTQCGGGASGRSGVELSHVVG